MTGFGTGLDTGVISRPAGTLPTATDLDACNKLDNIIFALKCRYTCATCCDLPQYDCEDAATVSRGNTRIDAASERGDKASNCKGNEELCDSPAAEYREMMLKECAETCKKYLADKKKRQRTEKSSEDCFDESRW
uniref:ShKT domain-containing protein n=1 Tax=Ditylenchus dipsaci TaxID=166011 RepID=A0A915CPQ5_9BILA